MTKYLQDYWNDEPSEKTAEELREQWEWDNADELMEIENEETKTEQL